MSEIIDLGSPDRELSAGDIKRKQKKLERTKERLKDTPTGTRKRHRLEFKQLKTQAQIKTGMSGIHVDKKPFKVSHQYDLQQDKKFNAPINMIGDPKVKKSTVSTPITEAEQDLFQKTWSKTYKSIKEQKYPGAVGVDLGTIKSKNPVDRLDKDGLISSAEGAEIGAYRKSALNMLGIKSKSPLNQEIPEGEWGTGRDLSQPFAGSGNVPTANPFDVQPSGQDENTTNPSWENSVTDEEWTDIKSKDGSRAQQVAFEALKTKYKKN